jgi:hypothetical protein
VIVPDPVLWIRTIRVIPVSGALIPVKFWAVEPVNCITEQPARSRLSTDAEAAKGNTFGAMMSLASLKSTLSVFLVSFRADQRVEMASEVNCPASLEIFSKLGLSIVRLFDTGFPLD